MRKVLYILGILSDSDVSWLAATGEQRSYQSGDVLITAGERIEELFILLQGRLSIRNGDATGVEIATRLPGEVVGELSFLDSRPPTATVVADGEVLVVAVSREALSAKLERDTEFAAHFYRALGVFLADRLRQTTSQLGSDVSAARDEDEESTGELDPDVLDHATLAARRFEMLLERMRGS